MESYTTGQIMLSTRDKLNMLNRKLKRLKELSYTENDKNIKDIRYAIYSSSLKDNPELQCIVDWNDKRLIGIIKNLKVKLNLYAWGREIGLLVRDNNGNCYIQNNNYNIGIPANNQEEFSQIASEIMKDEFAARFLNNVRLYSNDINNQIHIGTEAITITKLKEKNDCLYGTHLTYSISDQLLVLSSQKNIELTSGVMNELLGMKIINKCLNDYQRQFIENSNDRTKHIQIPDFEGEYKRVVFNVRENNKGLYLIKK